MGQYRQSTCCLNGRNDRLGCLPLTARRTALELGLDSTVIRRKSVAQDMNVSIS